MSLMVKSYACAIRKERKNMNPAVVEYIRSTKELIKQAEYSEAIKNLAYIYYVLMVPFEQRKGFEKTERHLDLLNENNLIN